MNIVDLAFLGLEAAWRRRYLIIVPILAMPPMAFFAAGFAPKSYEARTTILVQETAKMNPFLTDLAVGPNLKERMSALNALTHSSHVLEQVLRDVRQIDDGSSQPEREERTANLSAAISVELMGNDLVVFKIRGPHGEGLAATLTAVSNRFLERMLAPERSAITGSQSFLKTELAERETRLKKAQDALANFRMENASRLPTLESSNVTRLSDLQTKLSDNRMQLAAAKAELGDVKQRLIETNPMIGQIEEDILKGTRGLGDLRVRYTEEHSLVQAELRSLKRLQEERERLLKESQSIGDQDIEALWNMAAGSTMKSVEDAPALLVSQLGKLQETSQRHVRLETETTELTREVSVLEKAIAETGPVAQQQKQFEDNIQFAQASYDAIAKRFDNAEITGALGRFEAPERVKIIDMPIDPTSPVTPGRILFLLAGILGGLFLGAGLAAMAEILDTRPRRVIDFERLAGVPVLARCRL
jgi:uncharacterized protein involved in exopolysaccharide biosynthesis